jgi:hypothetical protein
MGSISQPPGNFKFVRALANFTKRPGDSCQERSAGFCHGRRMIKWLTACILMIAVAGCTSMRPIDGSPAELRQFINSGDLLKPGDRIRVVTADDKTHWFAITRLEAGLIVGPTESIPVDQVVSLEVEKRKFPVSIAFDLRDAVPWAIVIAAFALKPITVDATPP